MGHTQDHAGLRGGRVHDRAGAIGEVLRETVQHGIELLDIAEQEMEELEGMRYQVMAAASPMLRAKFRVLRDKIH